MLPLSATAIARKNSLFDTGAWVIFLDIVNKDQTIHLRICGATEDTVWGVDTYTAFPFTIGEIPEASRGALPTVPLQVSNVERAVQGYVENDPDFGSGWSVQLNILHSDSLPSGAAELTLSWTVLSVSAAEDFVTFNLGMPNPIRKQFPHRKFMSDTCQHVFKQGGCSYTGTDTTCDRTLEACRLKFPTADTLPALLFPGIPVGAIYK